MDSNNNPRPSGGGRSPADKLGGGSGEGPESKTDSPRTGGTRMKGKNPERPPQPVKR